MSLSRRVLREICMKLAYQYDFYSNPELLSQIDHYFEAEDFQADDFKAEDFNAEDFANEGLGEAEKEEIKERVTDLFNHVPEIDAMIEACAEGWKVKRMSKVDLSVLRLAVYEIKYDAQVPDSVAINEAVDLAKHYGGDHSYQFVNGVLSKIVK